MEDDNEFYNHFDNIEDVLVEIYRPEKDIKDNIYYEFGHINDIGTDTHGNKFHKVNKNLNEDSYITYYDGTNFVNEYFNMV